MDFESLRKRLVELIEPVVKDNFMDVVDIEVAVGPHIRVFVEKTGGNISVDECADLSSRINSMLAANGAAGDNYSLEVSSPGINRPLKKKEDFARFAGKKVKVVTKEKIGNDRVFIGVLNGFAADKVSVTAAGRTVEIDFDNIRKANIEEDVF